jgi:hypothetical protein
MGAYCLWLAGTTTSLTSGGLGLVNLIRSGFFKRLKEREARLTLMKADKERHTLKGETDNTKLDPAATARLLSPTSVTESTTRELEEPAKRRQSC